MERRQFLLRREPRRRRFFTSSGEDRGVLTECGRVHLYAHSPQHVHRRRYADCLSPRPHLIPPLGARTHMLDAFKNITGGKNKLVQKQADELELLIVTAREE